MEHGLRASVESHLQGKMSLSALQPLLGSLLLYVFRGCTQADVREVINREGYEFDFLSWRRELPSNGLLLKDQKIHSYWHFVNEERLGLDSISRKEANALECAMEHPKLRRHLKELVKYGARPMTIRQLDNYIGKSLYSSDVTAHMRTLVAKKMSFLVQSFGFTKSSLMAELQINALVTLLRSYPRYENLGHMKAICKASAHNHCINFIKTNTTTSRQRLQQNSDGTYRNVLVPLDMYGPDQSVSSEEGGISATLVTGIDGVSQSQWEQMFALRQVLESGKLKPRQRSFLTLALGRYDEAFSTFLGQPNDDYLEKRPYTDYLRAACRYLDIDETAAFKFLESLRKHF